MAKFKYDAHFKQFTQNLQEVICGYGSSDGNFTTKQKAQVEKLVRFERKFKRILQKDARGFQIYQKFIEHIWSSGKDKKRNILNARVFFRERHGGLSLGVSRAIKKKLPKSLYKFDINYMFISFVLKSHFWPPNGRIVKAAQDIIAIRKEIIELNMPLAIARARVFRGSTPESHLSYMDLVQISAEGLVTAVDKFVLPYTPVFRSVIIGMIQSGLIENYSDTLLHFYPPDKRKIYRANKAKARGKEMGFEELATVVNSGPELKRPTNSSEIQHLMSAATSIVPLDPIQAGNTDYSDGGVENQTLLNIYAADEGARPDVQVENMQMMDKLYGAIGELNVLGKKFIRMKGLDLGA